MSKKEDLDKALKASHTHSIADLRYTDLRFADLRSADLSYTDLRYTDLRSADLRSAKLTRTKIRIGLFIFEITSEKEKWKFTRVEE